MAKVRTVLGDVDPSVLGVVDAHEHLFITGGLATLREPDFRLDSVDAACQEVESFLALGGGALVDAMPLGCGRSVEGLIAVAKLTGAHIIATTGFHKEFYYDSLHWIYRYSEEQIARLLIGEVQEGMDEYGHNGPFPKVAPARAGALKVATDYQRISSTAEKLFAAVTAAHRATGAPIFTHTEHGTMALEQAERLTRLGADPAHLIIGHVDRNADLAYHREVAASGVYLQYDGMGRIKYQPESLSIGLIVGMFEAGYGDRLLLGGDLARRSYWRAFGGGPGFAYLLERFIPRLRAFGVDAAAVRQLLVDNPARAFQFREATP